MPKLRIRLQYFQADLFWWKSTSYPKQHMEMESQVTLLFHCTIISSCFTIHTLVISTNPQDVFYEHLDHEVEKLGSCNWVVSDELVMFVFQLKHLNVKSFFAVRKIQAHWMLVIGWGQGDIPYRGTHICYHRPNFAVHAFLLVINPTTFPSMWSRSQINWKHALSSSVDGFMISPIDILFTISSNTSWFMLNNLSAMLPKLHVSASNRPPVVDALTCWWLKVTKGKQISHWKHLLWYISKCCLCAWSDKDVALMPPRPYGNSQGNICGYRFGLLYIERGDESWETASAPPQLFQWRSAIPFRAFKDLVSYLSPVNPWTTKGQSPSWMPLSRASSNTLVPSSIFVVCKWWYSTETGGDCSG